MKNDKILIPEFIKNTKMMIICDLKVDLIKTKFTFLDPIQLF